MSTKILGFDLGTSSIGTALRNPDKGRELIDQLEYFSSDIFASGVGRNKTGEYSFAAERTKCRSARTLKRSRHRRRCETLKYLIQYGFCPLPAEELEKWKTYDKSRGLKREYPVGNKDFEQWIRMDFNGDGIPEYNPYELRAELMQRQFDFSDPTERYKLGRALYHIAQRRGFKSSKGETVSEQEKNAKDGQDLSVDVASAMKASEEKASTKLLTFMREHGLDPETHTVGEGFAALLKMGVRVRASEYKAVRSQYKEEIRRIFEFQQGLDVNSDFYLHLVSEKKGEGSIFYKNPLRSQKGTVGKCTLEPNKERCPISHPVYEEFRAWSLLNNIKYREQPKEDAPWLTLSMELKEELYETLFIGRVKSDFQFEDIREKLQKRTGLYLNGDKDGEHPRTINFKDNVSVAGCPISARLRKMLGDDWQSWQQEGTKQRKAHSKSDKDTLHTVIYTAETLWNVCFNADEVEEVSDFAQNRLGWDDKQAKDLLLLWGAMKQGYAMLSRKAMENINRMLRLGLIYSDAVLLAKVPDLIGKEKWDAVCATFLVDYQQQIKPSIERQKRIVGITNTLIANYKSLGDETGLFAYKDFEYTLQPDDHQQVLDTIIDAVGQCTWELMDADEQTSLIQGVTDGYQSFFYDMKRDFLHAPLLGDAIRDYLVKTISGMDELKWQKLYHPSMISVYKPVPAEADPSSLRLGRPDLGGIRNPVALRTLNVLRNKVNAMLDQGMIDPEETRIVVETTRDLKDANERWAIETYQKQREAQNKEIKDLLEKEYVNRIVNESDVDKVRDLLDQVGIEEDGTPSDGVVEDLIANNKRRIYGKNTDIKKYKLWLEQGCRCMYTGRLINISNLFDDNVCDFEHTIPRSLSFDSSDANLTICDAHYNRHIKKQLIPTQLPNYNRTVIIDGVTYTAIEPRLKRWKEKVEQLRSNVNYWKGQSKRAQDKDRKDQCIRQRHLWQMELDFWQAKLERFTMTEVKQGFRNSQLVDTGIIARHAVAYLKSIFAHVEVQKGSVTSDFRKMLGIQSIDEKKVRDLHSHHAIDATMLTVIPVAAKRDRMLKVFYQKEEKERLGQNTDVEMRIIEQEKKECQIGSNVTALPDAINERILINHRSIDRTLAPSRRKARVRGRVLRDMDAQGQMHDRYKQGDSIRGNLHGDTYYGAITQWKRDNDGKINLDEFGNPIVDPAIIYVVRKPLKYKANESDSGFKTWEDLEKSIVNKDFVTLLKKQYPEGTTLKEAAAIGFCIKLKNGQIQVVRHVRCFAFSKNPLVIGRQKYVSSKDYKNNVYAAVGDLFAIVKYSGGKDSEYKVYSMFDVSLNISYGMEPIPSFITSKKNQRMSLDYIIKAKDMVLLYETNPNELFDMTTEMLSHRLYKVMGFESDNRITLVRHLNTDNNLGKGDPVTDYKKMPSKIRCSIGKLKFLLLGNDFEITPQGTILFKHVR